jgi:chitinase
MKKVIVVLLIIVVSLFAEKKVVGYFYGPASDGEGVDISKLTHLISAFVHSTAEGKLKFYDWPSEEDVLSSIELAKENGVIPMISLGTTDGGWAMVQSKEARSEFIKNILAWCDSNGVQGVDLDLEGRAKEYNWGDDATFFPEGYEALAVELREAMPDTMLLASATGSYSNSDNDYCEQWTDTFIEQLDFLNAMIYDIALTWEESAVKNHSTWNDHVAAADYWHKKRGLEKDKINLGVPFYARGWDMVRDSVYYENAPWPNPVGTFGYRYFAKNYPIHPAQDMLVLKAGETLRYDRYEDSPGQVKAFFNSQDMIARKTAFAFDSSYGGVMIWNVAEDLPTTDDLSLLKAIIEVKNGEYVEPEEAYVPEPYIPDEPKDTEEDPTALAKPISQKKSNRAVMITSNSLSFTSSATVNIYTANGKAIFSQSGLKGQSINMPSFSKGVYLMSITSEAGRFQEKMIIK